MSEDSPDSQGTQKACCCHHKATPRSVQMQDDLHKRLNRVIGQLNGVKTMIDDNRYCGDVLMQLSAAESAVHSAPKLDTSPWASSPFSFFIM